jgi:hypothetical protein
MRMYHQESDNVQALLAGEGQLLELILEGAPLQQVMDKLCTALDVQLGNVVSLVLLPEDQEHTLHTIAQRAAKFGLSAFSCTAILSPSEKFFGTLEIYCCFPRKPDLGESKLIQRAAHLAALAIQNYNHDVDADSRSLDWTGSTGRSPQEGPPSSN